MTDDKCILFRVGDHQYATRVGTVKEIIQTPAIASLPRTQSGVLGVFNLRGSIVTALDGVVALGVDRAAGGAGHRAIITQLGNDLYGLLVDAATEVVTVREEEVRQLPESSGFDKAIATSAIVRGGRTTLIVDIQSLARRAREPVSAAIA